MNPSHEKILSGITEEFPVQIEHMEKYRELLPPVTYEYLHELCGDDEGLIELLDEMTEYFYRYTRDVCEQEALKVSGITENAEEIARRDGPRTILHNAMIESVRIFARNLQRRGKDSTWVGPIDKGGRAGYARLALLTTLTAIPRGTDSKPE